MKYILLSLLGVLILATVVDRISRRPDNADQPVLYWVTDTSAARQAEVELFYAWLEEKGYPQFEIRLDSTNKDVSKKLIQGVSGVGADLISMARDEAWLLQATGMMQDLLPLATKHGFTVDKTWPAISDQFLIDDQQVGFPRGSPVQAYLVNLELLEKLDQPIPSQRWTIEEFEAAGKAFMAAANTGDSRQKVFFCDLVNILTLRRSMGRSMYNETMTRCTLNNTEGARALGLLYQWIYEDRILPTQADLDFFAGSDTNTSRIQLFKQGRYALLTAARYSIVQMRDGPPMRMVARMSAHAGFPNGLIGTGSIGIYAKSEHKELAAYLLEFFASETYNMSVVRSSDSMPPVPEYTTTEEYLRPADFPGEWGVHEEMTDLMEIAIPPSVSPFVLPSSANRIEREFRLAVLASVYSPEEGAMLTEKFINREIELNVNKNPQLQQKHAQLLEDQATIDRLRAAGEPVPLELITNPFHRVYYVAQGWAAES
jgi:ABC-type glycerol-3-phosphate transport system substrate-binding protein